MHHLQQPRGISLVERLHSLTDQGLVLIRHWVASSDRRNDSR
jgi:hypothetical protein